MNSKAAEVACRRQERARRKCIERLLAELITRGIATVAFGQRHDELDARDRALVAALKRRHSLPAAVRTSWLADAFSVDRFLLG